MAKRTHQPEQLDLPLIPYKYRLNIDDSTHYWSGRGRLPFAFDHYIYEQNAHRLSNEVLKELLIKGAQS